MLPNLLVPARPRSIFILLAFILINLAAIIVLFEFLVEVGRAQHRLVAKLVVEVALKSTENNYKPEHENCDQCDKKGLVIKT